MAIDPGQMAIAMVLAVVLIAAIIACANYIHWFGRKHPKKPPDAQAFSLADAIVPPEHFILLRVLLDKTGQHASLSTFQFLMWTLLIAFLYITLWFLQFLNGNTSPPPIIPQNLLALMGISVAVPLVNKGIMEHKKSRSRTEGEVYVEPSYASMLEEDGKPSFLRLQMFLWTIAAVVIYFWSFLTAAFSPAMTAGALGLPDVDPTLLFLMGLSQVGYLGSKAYSGTVIREEDPGSTASAGTAAPTRQPPKPSLVIRETIPEMARPEETVTLLGSGFGTNKDTLMLGQERVKAENIVRWDDSRIEFTVPEAAMPGNYPLRVISGGSTAEVPLCVSESQWSQGLREVPAEIISEIWIDDISRKGYCIPPIGYFITGTRYHFLFEFTVPPGTLSWGQTLFTATFHVDGIRKGKEGFLPGNMNGENYGFFAYTFADEGKYTIEIRGATVKSMTADVRTPPGT